MYDIGKPTTNPGPMSVETLATILGLDAKPQNQGGTNYATSGARNNEPNNAASGGFPHAIPTTQQISTFLQTNILDNPRGEALYREAVYVISSGGNDVMLAVKQVESGQISDTIARGNVTKAANKLAKKIAVLHSKVAQYIVVARLPNSFGPDQTTKDYRKLYNTALTNKLDDLGVTVAFGRVNALRNKITNSMAAFNLTSVTSDSPSCPKPPLTFQISSAWALLCSPNSPVTKPSDPSKYLFADDEHWAEGGQQILGSYYYCLVKNTWPNLFNGYVAQPPISCRHFTSIM
jgi:phospholipase/lecithinase/hemolysin